MGSPGFWPRLRLRGMILHGLTVVDAALTTIGFVEQVQPDELKRVKEWKRIAEAYGIPIVEDDELQKARIERGLRAVMEDFGYIEADTPAE